MPPRIGRNENYFSDISLQSSYWAGFIAADGCGGMVLEIYHDGKTKGITVIFNDGKEIDKLARELVQAVRNAVTDSPYLGNTANWYTHSYTVDNNPLVGIQ